MTKRLLSLCLVVPFLLGAETGERPRQSDTRRYFFKMHAPDQAGIYFTAWAEGDVVSDHDGSDGKTVVYRRRFIWYDSCEWESTETLTPVSADRYTYKYREGPKTCPKGVTSNGVPTPKDGHVTVRPAPDDRPLTPLFGWMKAP